MLWPTMDTPSTAITIAMGGQGRDITPLKHYWPTAARGACICRAVPPSPCKKAHCLLPFPQHHVYHLPPSTSRTFLGTHLLGWAGSSLYPCHLSTMPWALFGIQTGRTAAGYAAVLRYRASAVWSLRFLPKTAATPTTALSRVLPNMLYHDLTFSYAMP